MRSMGAIVVGLGVALVVSLVGFGLAVFRGVDLANELDQARDDLADARNDIGSLEGELEAANDELTINNDLSTALASERTAAVQERDEARAQIAEMESEQETLHTIRGFLTAWPQDYGDSNYIRLGPPPEADERYECVVSFNGGGWTRFQQVNIGDGDNTVVASGAVYASHRRRDGGCSMHFVVPDVPPLQVYTLTIVGGGVDGGALRYTQTRLADTGWIALYQRGSRPDGFDDSDYELAGLVLPGDQADPAPQSAHPVPAWARYIEYPPTPPDDVPADEGCHGDGEERYCWAAGQYLCGPIPGKQRCEG